MNPEATEPAEKPVMRRLFMSLIRILLLMVVPFGVFALVTTRNVSYGTVLRRSRILRAHNEDQALCAALKSYYTDYGDAPTGENRTIIHTLEGDNPHRTIFIEFRDRSRATNGELLDPWGIPYKIDLSDPKNPRVYSFGPNKRDDGGMGDDVVSWR